MNSRARWAFRLCSAANVLTIAVPLSLWGAAQVRADGGAVFFLTMCGGVWLIITVRLFSWLGLSLHDDVFDRGNIAALIALCGALTAVALVYSGGSMGEGPSYWNNIFSIGLATAGFFVLWILLELAGGVSISIAEDRDLASGLRLCAFLLSIGMILGRAVAGDWHSESATIHDFARDGWPAAVLWVIALIIERAARPNRRRPFPSWSHLGLLPGLLYLAASVAWLWHLGAWEGMRR